MAQHDLDAALQLLADRAQFITGASGAAIALRRQGKNDMLCRASTGSNAPELGALLSTEFGLSGESVRTRQVLRCDDAERDARVNREVCRRLGIASVVVMPVVHDEEVLGVFELFSGKTNAFGERDLSAVQRLGRMVETAVQLAHVTEKLPEQLKAGQSSAAQTSVIDEQILDEHILEVDAHEPAPNIQEEPDVLPSTEAPVTPAGPEKKAEQAAAAAVPATGTREASHQSPEQAPPVGMKTSDEQLKAPVPEQAVPTTSQEQISKTPKPLLWSAVDAMAASDQRGESDQAHVPPVLRGLRKCEACGFPISGGRVLCVECEEKKWRGQLRRPQPMPTGAISQSAPAQDTAPAFAVAQAARSTASAFASPRQAFAAAVAPAPEPTRAVVPEQIPSSGMVQTPTPAFIFSGGLTDSSPSWVSRNKYVIWSLVLVAAAVAGFVLFR